jgi:hypothetical protein
MQLLDRELGALALPTGRPGIRGGLSSSKSVVTIVVVRKLNFYLLKDEDMWVATTGLNVRESRSVMGETA